MRGRGCDGCCGVRQPQHAQAEQAARGGRGRSREAPNGHARAERLRAGVLHDCHGEPGMQVHLAHGGRRARGICDLPLRWPPQGLEHSDGSGQLLAGGLRGVADGLALSQSRVFLRKTSGKL